MLSQSNNKFHTKIADAIFHTSPVSIFIVDNNGIIKSANKSASALLVLSEDILVSKSIFDLIPKVHILFPRTWWQKVLNRTNEVVTQLHDNNGNKIKVKISAQFNIEQDLHLLYILPINDSTPLTPGYLKSEDKLAAYFNSTSELIVLVSPQKLIVSFNKIFEQYVQMVFEKTVNEGDPIINFIVPDSKIEFHKNFDSAFNGKEVKLEKEVKYAGLSIWWAITYLPIRNEFDEILGVAFILQNIDDRKIAEESLIKSEERFKLVIEGSNEGWWDWDLTNNSLFYSPKWWHTLGYENNELINIANFWEKIVHSNDLEFIQLTFKEILANKNENKYQIEYNAKHKEGYFIPMLSRGFIKRDENGNALRVTGSDMDLRERQKSESLLIENQRKLQIAQKLALIGNYEVDLKTLTWKGSIAVFEILGIDANFTHTLLGLRKLLHYQFAEPVINFYKNAIFNKKPFTYEYKIVKPGTGQVVWISDFLDIDYDEKGNAVRLIGAIQNINDRKKGEDNLYKSEIKYRSLIENMDLGILEVDNNEIILKAYPKFCEMVGYTENELLGKNAKEVFLPKLEVDNYNNSIQARQAGLSNAYEVQILNKKQEVLHVIISGTPIFNENGKVVGSIGIHYNITNRKRTEKELTESQETFKMLFSLSPIPLIITEPSSGEIKLANKAMQAILSMPENDLVGRETTLIFENLSERNNINNLINKNGSVKDYQTHIIDSHGNLLLVLLSVEVIEMKGKKMYLKSFIDITERIKIEQELTNSLNLVTEQNKRLLNFSYIVSHNLRSHTSNIKSIVNFLNTSTEEGERVELTSHLTNVSEMLDETLNNLNEVLSIQKNVNITVEKINLSFYIDKALSVLKDQIEKKNIQIISNYDTSLEVNFNAAYLESIVYNLISNAIKYSKQNNMVPSFIRINTVVNDNKYSLSIADNGIGMDMVKNGDKLFGMYKTFHDNEDARGIGLFITKNQIEAMGGKIEVFSELGVGTTFKITFK